MRRNVLIVLAVIVAAGLGIYVLSGAGGPGAGASPSPTIAPVPAADTVTADAQVVPARGAELSAPGAGGRVTDVLVKEGDQVPADAPLLRLDDRAAQADLASAQAALASAQAGVRPGRRRHPAGGRRDRCRRGGRDPGPSRRDHR